VGVSDRAQDTDWLELCRRATDALRTILADAPSTEERVREVGTRGEGGDRTLVIDAAAEEAVFEQLAALHDDGLRFTAVSEERGTIDFGDPDVLVVVDPIDGSVNAKRGLPHHSISIAVADGPTMADVFFGYVYDFGPEEEWIARRGKGAWLDKRRLPADAGERRGRDGRLELLGIESADPRWVREAADALAERAYRLRALGTMASSVCQVAAARLDGMVSLRRCRAVDVAAAQLIVREAGGAVAFPWFDDPLGAPLDIPPHSPIVAARTERTVGELSGIPPARGTL
jgi:myo-inositol-1(or 4)-monophosphatase